MSLTQLNVFNLFSSSSLYSSLLLILIIPSIWWELTFCCEDLSKETLEQLIFILLLFPHLPLAVLGFFFNLLVCFKAQNLFSSPSRPLASSSFSALILEHHWMFPTLGLHKQKGNVWFESQGGKSCSDVPQPRNWGHEVVYRTYHQRD